MPLGRTHRTATRQHRPRPRRSDHRPTHRGTTRECAHSVARLTQDSLVRPDHHTPAIPHHRAAQAPRTSQQRVRVHRRRRNLVVAQRIHPPSTQTSRQRQRRSFSIRCPHGADPARTDLPRTATQPQDMAHRRRRTRDRPSPPTRPPPTQPRHRGLLPRRTRSRTPTAGSGSATARNQTSSPCARQTSRPTRASVPTRSKQPCIDGHDTTHPLDGTHLPQHALHTCPAATEPPPKRAVPA